MLLEVNGVRKAFGGLHALQGVDVTVAEGQVVGLIGPNGSGKSTLFDIITGFQRCDAGEITYLGEHIEGWRPDEIARRGLVRTFQMSEGGLRLTAIENLMAAAPGQREHRLLAAALRLPATMRVERANLRRAREIIALLGLTAVADEYVGNLSGGQKKLLDLGRILMAQPQLSLLDEPTAGVNPSLIPVIIDTLRRMNQEHGISLLIVEHNMQVVQEFCDHVYVLDTGRLICEGTPGGGARGCAGARQLSRTRARAHRIGPMGLISVSNLHSGYGVNEIIHGIDFVADPREIVTILGPNGCGKSTFIRSLLGYVKVTRGTVRFNGSDISSLSPTARMRLGIGYVPQLANVFRPLTVRENLEMGGYGLHRREIEAMIAKAVRIVPGAEGKEWAGGGNLERGRAPGPGDGESHDGVAETDLSRRTLGRPVAGESGRSVRLRADHRRAGHGGGGDRAGRAAGACHLLARLRARHRPRGIPRLRHRDRLG